MAPLQAWLEIAARRARCWPLATGLRHDHGADWGRGMRELGCKKTGAHRVQQNNI